MGQFFAKRCCYKAEAVSIENLLRMESSLYHRETTALKRDEQNNEMVEDLEFVPLEAQAGGRSHQNLTEKDESVGCLQNKKHGLVMKALQEGDRGRREASFYRKIFEENPGDDEEAVMFLRDFVPKFYGVVQRDDDSYVMLEDLTRGFHRPNVIDFKIGTQTFDPFASEAKREKMLAKHCMIKDVGFCVTDYRQYDPSSETFRDTEDVGGKEFWRLLTNDQMGVEIRRRLLPSDPAIRRQLIEACLERLVPLQNFFHRQRSFAFYSSSILVIYEGDPDGVSLSPDISAPSPIAADVNVSSLTDDDSNSRQISTTPNPLSSTAHSKVTRPPSAADLRQMSPRLYLIDFAHAYHLNEVGLTTDQGCAKGLDNLVAHFKDFLKTCT